MNKFSSIIYILAFLITFLAILGCKKDDLESLQEEQKSHIKAENDVEQSQYYVGRDSCSACHTREYELWKGSDHDLAMQEANKQTVLGNFDNATFTYYGITSKFYKRDDKFYVFTEGPEGNFKEYEIKYTFGFRPLQQYIIQFPGGRYQMLPLCWDTRPKEQGGQKWFHIYPDERITPDDVLYWTKILQNWNYMCAECHSTNVKKKYNLKKDSYQTTYSEIDVSCEACHGPSSEHVTWARLVERGKKIDRESTMGLVIRLKDYEQGTWVFNTETGSAQRTIPLRSRLQIEICWRCHSRRYVINEDYIPGGHLLNTHIPSLLVSDLYFPDGQIQDEVYVYGSFLQSKMYRKGVVCRDCHEPHSMKVYAAGNRLCYRCHLYEKFGVKSHHFHKSDSIGALCVECHMPERTYMVIDPRRDHSIRIPRSDLSGKLGTPNACNKCHKDKDTQWSTEYIKKWYGADFTKRPHYGEVIFAGRNENPGTESMLITLYADTSQSSIVRATALWLLRNYPTEPTVYALQGALNDSDPLIRYAALHALDILEPNERLARAKHLLQDQVRAVRMQAARSLSAVSSGALSPSRKKIWERAIEEYIQSQLVTGDHPASHLNLGTLYLNLKEYEKAEESYLTAIRIEPNSLFAYINLADLYRIQEREKEGEQILRQALEIDQNYEEGHYALGLLFARQKSMREAVFHLRKAEELNPADPNFSYAYGIALNSIGKPDSALLVLDQAHTRHPYNQQLLYALATISRDLGSLSSAILYAQKLVKLAPQNQRYQQLLIQLKSMSRS